MATAEILAEVTRLAAGLKEEIKRGIGDNGVIDVAFMGGLSPIYPFRPALNLDLDFCVVAQRRDAVLGAWLLDLRSWCLREWRIGQLTCDVRVVRGPIKDVPSTLDRAHLTLHPAVFVEDEYRRMSPLLRWSWRKYACEVDPDRLHRLAPSQRPGLPELLSSRGGVQRTIEHLEEGIADMREWVLPGFEESPQRVTKADPLWVEYCLSKVAVIARGHARCLGLAEPDFLANEPFADWYYENVFRSEEFRQLMKTKENVRRSGYGVSPPDVHGLTLTYLRRVANLCGEAASSIAAP